MPIPDLSYPEVEYAGTALKTVVCQLRFHPILKIGQAEPADFQERVRRAFPLFDRQEGMEFSISMGLSARPKVEAMPTVSSITWRFLSEDSAWIGALAPTFMSLETSEYRHFPDFEERFAILLAALDEVYAVDTFTRVGLRYVNVFEASRFPGGWAHRFNRSLLGPAADEVMSPHISSNQNVLVLSLDESVIRLRQALERDGNFVLDMDHSTESGVTRDRISPTIREFNKRIYQVFRWSISETLHEEMEPHPRD